MYEESVYKYRNEVYEYRKSTYICTNTQNNESLTRCMKTLCRNTMFLLS